MNEECKHFQSRTYDSGEVARFCQLDLAPDAPWRCPASCPSYERRLADVGWVHGSLVEPALEEAPVELTPEVTALLRDAESIVADAGPAALREVRAQQATEGKGPKWWPFSRRRG